MRVVTRQFKILKLKIEQPVQAAQLICPGYLQPGQFFWLAGEQYVHLVEVICIDVEIAECVDELADPEAADVRDEVGEQCVAANVEGYAEEGIGGALVKLAVKRFLVFYLELEERVTGG